MAEIFHELAPRLVAPYCLVSVDDGFVATTPTALLVNFDVAPILTANRLIIEQGATVILTSSMLSATDQDSDIKELIFKVNNIIHGQFNFGSTQSNITLVFKQKDIISGDVRFTHDGSLLAPYYDVVVSDSLLDIRAQPALITFSLQEQTTNSNTVRNAVLSACLTGSVGLGLWLFKKYVNNKTNKEFSGEDMQNMVCKALLNRIKVSGCLDYMSAGLVKDLRGAINKLFEALLGLGIIINAQVMELYEQRKLVDEIVRQIEKTLLPERSICNKFIRFFKNYCVAEITPSQIENYAAEIARAVKTSLTRISLSGSEIELYTSNRKATFVRNPLASVKEIAITSAKRVELVTVHVSNNALNSVSGHSTSTVSMSQLQSITANESENMEQQLQKICKEGEGVLHEVAILEELQSKEKMTSNKI